METPKPFDPHGNIWGCRTSEELGKLFDFIECLKEDFSQCEDFIKLIEDFDAFVQNPRVYSQHALEWFKKHITRVSEETEKIVNQIMLIDKKLEGELLRKINTAEPGYDDPNKDFKKHGLFKNCFSWWDCKMFWEGLVLVRGILSKCEQWIECRHRQRLAGAFCLGATVTPENPAEHFGTIPPMTGYSDDYESGHIKFGKIKHQVLFIKKEKEGAYRTLTKNLMILTPVEQHTSKVKHCLGGRDGSVFAFVEHEKRGEYPYLTDPELQEITTVCDWKDFGVANVQTVLGHVLKILLLLIQDQKVYIHCRGSIGRTGVVWFVIEAFQLMIRGHPIDLIELLKKLRFIRTGVIQTKEQFDMAVQMVHELKALMDKAVDQLGDERSTQVLIEKMIELFQV